MLKKVLFALAALCVLLPCSGAEKVIRKFPDATLTTNLKTKWAVTSKSFYIYAKEAQKFRGKKVVFRADATRVKGSASLGAGFRCSTKPGGLQAHNSFKFDSAENGKTVFVEAVVDIPDLENISQFNIQLAFRKKGKEITSWELKNIRFCEFDEAAARRIAKKAAEEKKVALPEGFAAEYTAKTAAKPLELVKDGKVLFTIVIPDKADNIAKFAAAEVAAHFKLAVGSAPAIIAESAYKSGPAIMIGATALAQKYGIDPDMLVPEYSVAARLNDVVVLSGGDAKEVPMESVKRRATVAVGTLFAAYDFLENVLGIRWYWPGKYGTHVPQTKNVSVHKLYLTAKPVYDTRTFFYSSMKGDPDVKSAEGALWFRRMRFGGSMGSPIANHSFNTWVKRFAKSKPEYLALQADGTRKTSDKPGGGHVCLSNPDVFKQTVQDKLDAFARNPNNKFSAVMPGDSLGLFHCRCDNCMKQVNTKATERGAFSNLVWGYVNRVAAEVAKKAPGRIITCCSYGSYQRRPDFPLNSNVAVTLCFGPVPRGTLSYKKAWKKIIDEWSATGARLYVWEYWNNSRYSRGVYGAPAIYPRQLKEIYAIDAGRISGRAIELSNVDGSGQSFKHWTDWLYDAQNIYVAGKLMWDLNADVDKILDDYYRDFFGPAEKPIRRFHEEMEAAWVRKGWLAGKWDFRRVWGELYPPAFVDRMMGLLKEAVKLAGNKEPYAYRTRKLLAAYKPFEVNSRMFRGGSRKTNPAVITVPKVAGKPAADEWNKGVVLKNFSDAYNVYTQASQTEMRLLHDGKFLYIKAKCTIPPLVSTVKWVPKHIGTRDGMLWSYESLEFFLARGKELYQFILAPDNRLYDAHSAPGGRRNSAVKWNAKKVSFSTTKGSTTWEGFLAIPLDEIQFAGKAHGGEFKFNAYRNCRYNFPNEPMTWEQSCYLPVFGSFYNTERFGTLKLGK